METIGDVVEDVIEDVMLYEKIIRCSTVYIFNGRHYTIKNTIIIDEDGSICGRVDGNVIYWSIPIPSPIEN